MFRKIKRVYQMFKMRFSEKYHNDICQKYWSAPKVATHGKVNEEDFQFYANEILKLIRSFCNNLEGKTILDYGAGRGEIIERINQSINDCFCVAAEFSENFMEVIEKKGIKAIAARQLPQGTFDIIFCNCAFYYNHPSKQLTEINRILLALKPGGILLLTDNPTLKKIPILYKDDKQFGNLHYLVAKYTQVYQLEQGGFFLDEERLQREFETMQVLASWSDYRSHFIFVKK